MNRIPRRTTHRLVALLSALTVVMTALVLPAPSQAEGENASGIVEVGRLDRFPKDAVAAFGTSILPTDDGFASANEIYGGTLINVPQRGELWQLFVPTTGPDRTLIAVRRMDSLRMIDTIEIPYHLHRGATNAHGGDWLHTFDGDRRIFLVPSAGSRRHVIAIDLATRAVRTYDLGPPVAVGNFTTSSFAIGALEYDSHNDSIVMIFGGPVGFGAGAVATYVYRYFLDTGSAETRLLRTCQGPFPSAESSVLYQTELLFTDQYMYVPCQRAGAIATVVRIARNDFMSASSAEDVVVGPGFLEGAFADPVSGRIFLITLGGEIWAFDTATMAFVGVVAAAAEGVANPRVGYGFDRTTGRLYFQSSTYGLGVAEGRFFPMPQARVDAKVKGQGQARIISDAVSGRFFVNIGFQNERELFYTIYQAGPAAPPPPPPDPDASTNDVDEKDGVTESRYFASGTGYGVRTLLARGLITVAPAPTAGQVSPTGQVIDDYVNSKCGYTDRELVGARIVKAEYDPGATAASAVGVDVDDRTKVDLEHLKRCDIVIKDGTNEVFEGFFSTSPTADVLAAREETADPGYEWTAKGSSCSSSAGGDPVNEKPVKDESSTKCPKPGEELTARARATFEAPTEAGRQSVSVGRTETKTTIKKTAKGVVSEVEAEAADIELVDIPGMGIVRIGEITSKATSRSNGRPNRKDMSTHSVTISGVRVGATTICASNCVIDEVARRLNVLAGGRADFRTASGLDEDLRRGTPKGALTAVQKSVARQASDQALVGDFTTEVPALEVLVYNDNNQFGRARQLYQFAGVATAATYNISLVPNGSGFPDDPGFNEDELSPSGGIDGFISGTGTGTGSPIASLGGGGGGGSVIERVVRAVARGLRMFFSNPRHALLLLTAWSLLSLPPVLSRRRRLLYDARSA